MGIYDIPTSKKQKKLDPREIMTFLLSVWSEQI